jgi:tRNA(Arg) A34 adenosine deaminase TadA
VTGATSRRAAIAGALLLAARPVAAREPIEQPPSADARSFMARAFDMRRQALAAGDQAYGAVVVLDGRIVGQAPSAVISRGDPAAHAEREAILDARRRLDGQPIRGAMLYSSSRPCARCEEAAHAAGIARMIHGTELLDAGAPRAAP